MLELSSEETTGKLNYEFIGFDLFFDLSYYF